MNKLSRLVLAFSVVLAGSFISGAQTRPTATPTPRPTVPVGSTQTTNPTGQKRIGIIFSAAFEVPDRGIKKMIDTNKSVDALFKTDLDWLTNSLKRLQSLEAEIGALQKQLETPPSASVPVDVNRLQTNLAAKQSEFESLGREYGFRREQTKAAFQAKRKELIEPIIIEVGRAVLEYAKARGFSVIFDGSRMQEYGVIIGLDDKLDVTADFITFFNAKSATPTVK